MVGLELVVGYLISWAVARARKVGQSLGDEADNALGAGLKRLHDVVARRLGPDPALADLQDEAAAGGAVSELTRQRVDLAIRAAVAKDPAFAEAVEEALRQLSAAGAGAAASGERSAAVGRDAVLHAEGGSAAALTMGDVTIGAAPVDPPQPGRSRD